MSEAKHSQLKLALWFTLRWTGRILCALFLFYASFLALGCVPINRGFQPATGADRVVIYIRSNEIHTDLVVPVTSHDCDWREKFPPADFRGNVSNSNYLAIGWGNRSFFIDTPSWADFKMSTAARALFWPSETVLHVEYVTPDATCRAVAITPEQYEQLAAFIASSVVADGEGRARLASEKSYYSHDRFYESSGRYHVFNTCNQWTGRGLSRAGVTTGLWTPLKPQVLWWLPPANDMSN